jgi:hypothetical protein
MLSIRCKCCNKEVHGHSAQAKSCGCPNLATVRGDRISAVDLNEVIIISSPVEKKADSLFTNLEMAEIEARRKRKVRKLDFEVR